MNINEVIRLITDRTLAQRGVSQKVLATEMGLTQPTLNRARSGENEPQAKTLAAIAKYYGMTHDSMLDLTRISRDDLLLSLDSICEKRGAKFDANVAASHESQRPIPVISAVQAGLLTDIADPYPAGAGFDVEYVDSSCSRWTFALEISGESMLPEFRPGDRVIIDPELSPMPGDYVVAKNDSEEATFKKYRPRGRSADGTDVFELVPLNDDYPTIRSDEHSMRVIGVMIEHRKRYRRK